MLTWRVAFRGKTLWALCDPVVFVMASTIAVRYALMFTMLAFLACGEGPGGAQDTIPGEARKPQEETNS